MSTTYVLHGGKSSIQSDANDAFFAQASLLVPKDNINIILCFWSRPKELWDELTKRDSSNFARQTKKKVTFIVAQDVEHLYKELETADALYVCGGEPEYIEPFVPKLSKLKTKLDGKVYLGTSMGAFVASKHYVLSENVREKGEVHHGIGMVNVKTLCHWNVETNKELLIELLRKESPQLPIVLLDEQKFTTFVC